MFIWEQHILEKKQLEELTDILESLTFVEISCFSRADEPLCSVTKPNRSELLIKLCPM